MEGMRGAAALAALPAFAACSTGTSRGSSASGGSGAGGSKTVTVRDSGGAYGEALKKAIYDPFTNETGITAQVANLDGASFIGSRNAA
jgi:putative spermidine/putrescine transport system substrate-binding protein